MDAWRPPPDVMPYRASTSIAVVEAVDDCT
jgi:hypothetical protein